MPSLTLLLSHRDSEDRRAILPVCEARADAQPLILAGHRVPAQLRERAALRIYAEPLFADVVASQLGLALLEAPLEWLTGLPEDLLGRTVQQTTIAQVKDMRFPRFVKAIDDKRIDPRVYTSPDAIPGIDVVDDDAVVLTAEPLAMESEVRLFLRDGRIAAGSMYLHRGRPHMVELSRLPTRAELSRFAMGAMRRIGDTLPRATVLDIASTPDGRWFIVEANAAWGAGLYASDPAGALDAVLAASTLDPSPAERPFVRAAVDVDFG